MTHRVTRGIAEGADGGARVVMKAAIEPEQQRALLHEAETLRSLRHPGVVQFVDLVRRPDHLELHTASAGSSTLADHQASSLGAVAGVVAAVAGVIADLHHAGIAHGALAADHVIIGPARHPVLCSFASSGPADADTTAADLRGLADLIETLGGRVGATPGRGERRQRRALALAVDACRSGASAREVARMLAAMPGAVADAVGSGSTAAAPTGGQRRLSAAGERPGDEAAGTDQGDLGTRTWRDRVPPPSTSTGRRSLVIAAVVALGAVLLTAMSLRPTPERPTRPAPDASAGIERSGRTATPPVDGSEPPATPPPGCPAGTFDIDHDGCDDAVTVHGNLILVNGQWFEAGRAGDVVAVGDWDCDGDATAAVLRPDTGHVFIFAGWGTSTTEAADQAQGAVDLTLVHEGGCPRLHTVDAQGRTSPHPVRTS